MSALVDAPVPASEPARTTDSAALALDYADRIVLAAVRDIHRRVASRMLPGTRIVGGHLPERIHSATSNVVYAGMSSAMRGSANGLRALARRGVGAPLESSASGRQLLSTINALVGAELAEAGDPGHIQMALRAGTQDVPVDTRSLARAYPDATGKVVLFLHGLGENDESWTLRSVSDRATYAERVTSQTDRTPLVLRYNTGLPVSENGAELAHLLRELMLRWPVPITSIAFVGHSMGALLARSTTVQAYAAGQEWVDRVTDVVCLGTPHLGAQLEKAVHLGARALALLPSSAPLGAMLDAQSTVVELRQGCVTRDEWSGRDLTAQWGEDRIAVAPLPDAQYHFVAAAVGQQTQHAVSRAWDDLLERFPGTVGRGHHDETVCHPADAAPLGGADHVALLNHPLIADQLVTLLQRATDELAASRTDEGDVMPAYGRHRAAV